MGSGSIGYRGNPSIYAAEALAAKIRAYDLAAAAEALAEAEAAVAEAEARAEVPEPEVVAEPAPEEPTRRRPSTADRSEQET